ncbi:BppU family phage baseplate upper protein [Aedoeadaptatus coxii]|uniref:BppU family phage baseplate upper protein n=1 Tax=Aedoeadaptatus coxii TaxID=755172 RepID=UPI002AD538B5|nr:BppU family phage baseplate upper protein [Peptoniphilus coxii]
MNNNKPIRLKFDRYYRADLFATQGDTGRSFTLEILDDYGKPIDLTGATLRLYVAAGDEVTYADGIIDDAKKGKATVQLYNSQLKFPGKQKAQFVLTGADGHKIGSKIFDLYVEKELAAGPTLGKNLYVDFEAVEKTLKLIEAYDKSLEIGRELDHALKVKIEEGTDIKNSLADTTLKALKVKTDVENTTQAATTEKDALNKLKGESETLRDDLTAQNEKAVSDMEQAVATARNATEVLSTVTRRATEAEKTLKETNTTAEVTEKNLSAADTEAKGTEKKIRELMDRLDATKGEVNAIIARGDLDKYVTDPELVERLNGYTTKIEFAEANGTLEHNYNMLKTASEHAYQDLDNGKLNKSDVIDDLWTGGVDKAISAEAAKSLNAKCEHMLRKADEMDIGLGEIYPLVKVLEKYQPEEKTVDGLTYTKIGNLVTVTGYVQGNYSFNKLVETMPYKINDEIIVAAYSSYDPVPVFLKIANYEIRYASRQSVNGRLSLNFSFISKSA